jgi:hypothetical protein
MRAVPGTRSDALKFRLKAFGLHLSVSATLLALVLGSFYLGWYRWPGWYLAGVSRAAITMMTVDVVLGPLMTLLIASSTKPARVLARDIAVIAAVQLAALVYGAITLWQGRPLYYVYAINRVEMIQAGGIDPSEVVLMRTQIPELAPTWHSLPRWVSAPYVPTPHEFKTWERGIPELRQHLRKVNDQLVFTKSQKESLGRKMEQLGFAVNQPDTIFLNGRTSKLLVVLDRNTMRPVAILSPRS